MTSESYGRGGGGGEGQGSGHAVYWGEGTFGFCLALLSVISCSSGLASATSCSFICVQGGAYVRAYKSSVAYSQGVQRNLGRALPQDPWGPVEEVQPRLKPLLALHRGGG